MADSLPQMAQSEGLTRSGERQADLTIADDLSKAVDMLARLKQDEMSVEDFLAQKGFFERELNPGQEKILVFLNENARSRKRVREFMRSYAKAVVDSPHPAQSSMFQEAQENKSELLGRLIATQESEAQGGEQGLFGLITEREKAATFGGGERVTARGAITPSAPTATNSQELAESGGGERTADSAGTPSSGTTGLDEDAQAAAPPGVAKADVLGSDVVGLGPNKRTEGVKAAKTRIADLKASIASMEHDSAALKKLGIDAPIQGTPGQRFRDQSIKSDKERIAFIEEFLGDETPSMDEGTIERLSNALGMDSVTTRNLLARHFPEHTSAQVDRTPRSDDTPELTAEIIRDDRPGNWWKIVGNDERGVTVGFTFRTEKDARDHLRNIRTVRTVQDTGDVPDPVRGGAYMLSEWSALQGPTLWGALPETRDFNIKVAQFETAMIDRLGKKTYDRYFKQRTVGLPSSFQHDQLSGISYEMRQGKEHTFFTPMPRTRESFDKVRATYKARLDAQIAWMDAANIDELYDPNTDPQLLVDKYAKDGARLHELVKENLELNHGIVVPMRSEETEGEVPSWYAIQDGRASLADLANKRADNKRKANAANDKRDNENARQFKTFKAVFAAKAAQGTGISTNKAQLTKLARTVDPSYQFELQSYGTQRHQTFRAKLDTHKAWLRESPLASVLGPEMSTPEEAAEALVHYIGIWDGHTATREESWKKASEQMRSELNTASSFDGGVDAPPKPVEVPETKPKPGKPERESMPPATSKAGNVGTPVGQYKNAISELMASSNPSDDALDALGQHAKAANITDKKFRSDLAKVGLSSERIGRLFPAESAPAPTQSRPKIAFKDTRVNVGLTGDMAVNKVAMVDGNQVIFANGVDAGGPLIQPLTESWQILTDAQVEIWLNVPANNTSARGITASRIREFVNNSEQIKTRVETQQQTAAVQDAEEDAFERRREERQGEGFGVSIGDLHAGDILEEAGDGSRLVVASTEDDTLIVHPEGDVGDQWVAGPSMMRYYKVIEPTAPAPTPARRRPSKLLAKLSLDVPARPAPTEQPRPESPSIHAPRRKRPSKLIEKLSITPTPAPAATVEPTPVPEPTRTKTAPAPPQSAKPRRPDQKVIGQGAALGRFLDVSEGSGTGRNRSPALDARITARETAPRVAETDQEIAAQNRWFRHPNEMDFEGIDTQGGFKPDARIRHTANGVTLPEGFTPTIVGWRQGKVFVYENLGIGQRFSTGKALWQIPEGDGITPQQSFRVLAINQRMAPARSIPMGIVTARVEGSGVTFTNNERRSKPRDRTFARSGM